MKITIDGRTFVGNSVVVELESYFILVNSHGETLYHGWDGSSDWETDSRADKNGFTTVRFETAEQAEAAAAELVSEGHGLQWVSVTEVTPEVPFIAFRSGGPY